MKTYLINGENFSTLAEFYDAIEKVLIPNSTWGRNFDAFNDILSGGFGTPVEGFELVWKNSNVSRIELGYDETVRVLSQRLLDCHPANRESVAKQIEDARHKTGPTVFDCLIEIIRDHGPQGAEAGDNVNLRLE